MISLNLVLNTLGLLLSLMGGYFGARSFLKDKKELFYRRSFFSFFDEDSFYSFFEQKYNGLWGLSLISLGSATQLITLIWSKETEEVSVNIGKSVCFIFLVLLCIVISFVSAKIITFKVNFETKKILIPKDLAELREYQESKEEISQNVQKCLSNLCRRLKIPDKTSPDEVIDKALRFCRKYNLKVR